MPDNNETPNGTRTESVPQAEPNAQDTQAAQASPDAPKDKRPRNIVTDFYDSLNISVRQLDIALVVLCAFILIVIVLASHFGA